MKGRPPGIIDDKNNGVYILQTLLEDRSEYSTG